MSLGEFAPKTGGGYKGEVYGKNSGQIQVNAAGAGAGALGPGATAQGRTAIAIGPLSFANQNAVSIGDNAISPGVAGVSIGTNSSSTAYGVSIGWSALAYGQASTCVGEASKSFNNYSASYGAEAGSTDTSQPNYSITIGFQARTQGAAAGNSNISIGYQSGRSGAGSSAHEGNVCIGHRAIALSNSGADGAVSNNVIIGLRAYAAASTFASNLGVQNSIVIGTDARVQAGSAAGGNVDSAIAIGNYSVAAANRAINIGGDINAVNSQVASTAIGYWNNIESPSQFVFSGGGFASFPRYSMIGTNKLWMQTTTSTQTVLGCATGTTYTSNTPTGALLLDNNGTYLFNCNIVAREALSAGVAKAWTLRFVVDRGASAATTQILGTPTTTVIAEMSSSTSWLVDVVANTTRGAPDIRVTGEAGKTIRWVCDAQFVKVG